MSKEATLAGEANRRNFGGLLQFARRQRLRCELERAETYRCSARFLERISDMRRGRSTRCADAVSP